MTTVTLGLDGASFELIETWLADGTLPHLAEVRADGVAGDMQSCLPPVTCPNWNCYATGTNPGKLGVFWWEAIDRSERTIRNTSGAGNFEGTFFWSWLDGRVAVVNLPTSYPPPSVDGIHVAGGPGAQQTGYTYPESLETTLEANYGYQVHPETMASLSKDDPESPCVDEIYELIEQRFDVLLGELATGDYEFLHTTVFYLNVLQHFYWDHEVVEEAWRRIDDRVGDLLAANELDRLVVMSDHGSNEIEIEFNVNTWLAERGYLRTMESSVTLLSKAGITRERVRPVLDKLRLEWWARRLVPDRVQDMVPDDDGRVKKTGKERVIDWERSTAVASGQGPVYVLATDPDERERIRSELVTALDRLSTDDGRTVIEAARPATDVYDGPHVADGPDIVLVQAPNVHIDGNIGAGSVFDTPDTWRGENKDTGLFMAWGDDIDDGTAPPDMHILDIAPTLLHAHGKPVPSALDGTVQTDVFAPESDPATRELETVHVDGASVGKRDDAAAETATDRLEDLGYL